MSSTQTFSDPAELERRTALVQSKYQGHQGGNPLIEPATDHGRGTNANTGKAIDVTTPANLSVIELAEALKNAALESLPDARLVLAHARWLDGEDPATILLPHSICGWDITGVVQRLQDINFTICLPFHHPPIDRAFSRLIPTTLQCKIYYDPTTDQCLFVSETTMAIHMAGLHPTARQQRIAFGQHRVVEPGLWRISVGGGDDGKPEQHLLDFLILQRQFTVTLHNPCRGESSVSGKRSAPDEAELGTKRRRREGHETEIVLAPATASRSLEGTASSLLDLDNNEMAAVWTAESINTATNRSSLPEGSGKTLSTSNAGAYKVTRLKLITDRSSATVFIGRHSELPDDIVAKVIRYQGKKTPKDLRNIVSLKAFDGRLFAIYIERLPHSLQRGLSSPFKPSDAQAILRHMSSALAYLETARITHNDIKPANIAYSPARGAVLLDFGLALSSDENILPGGTPWYIPPEFIDEGTRGAKGDAWALGVTMLYVLGKTTLPERTSPGWIIRDIGSKNGEARDKMEAWLGVVSRSRDTLDRTDNVEDLVSQMLEPKTGLRAQAAETSIVLGLGYLRTA
ncbi:hypothetical protein VDGE_30211 [Verticillium dahliae]|uniref:Protein kinase domain-containing protein n=1 Tax=Verticillium dahliae TaxID=27337 RepID=A0A444RN43_VERDA|nr:hypothetical protein VDGE_30211 [Verticillium dahliae]